MILDYIILAYEGIKHRKLRSWLTMLGIFIGIASIVSLFSLGQGLQVALDEQFKEIGVNKIFIQPGSSSGFTTSFTSSILDEDDMAVAERVNGVSGAAGMIMSTAKVKSNDKTMFLYVHGMPIDHSLELASTAANLKIEFGRTFKSTDRKKALIGSDLASSDVAFGKTIGLHDRITIEGTEYEVVGILKSQGNQIDDRIVWIPLNEAREILGYKEKQLDFIFLETSKGYEPSDVAESVKKELRRYRNVKEGEEDFQVQTFEKVIEAFKGVFLIVQLVVLGITSISLIIGGIGIMNTMYTAVVERTTEVGIMKAVGARNSSILMLFLVESGLIGMAGGTIGVVLGVAFSKLVELAGTAYLGTNLLHAFFPWYLILGTIAFSFVIGAMAGAYPAYQASKLQPVEALRK